MRDAITQKHAMGCGIACTAFVLGCTYDQALRHLRKTRTDAVTAGVLCHEIAEAFSRKGINAMYRYIKPRIRHSIYGDGTIVFIARCKRYPYGHYLCRWNGQWMDPWINAVSDPVLRRVKSGWRKRLPGRPIYAIFIKRV